MDTLETRRIEMFRRVRELGLEHAEQFPPKSFGADLFKGLDEEIKKLDEHALRQSTGQSSVRESISSKSVLRDELWRRVEAITRTARVMAYTSPGVEDKFRLTRGIGDQALLRLARTFASDAEPLKEEFIRRGMAATFIEDLLEAASEFEAAINRKSQGRSAHVVASTLIDKHIEQGLRIVRELDALFRNIFADDAATLAAWESASHVEHNTRRPKAKPAPPSGTPDSK